MHSILHIISLSHIKKAVAKSFAVLFSVGLIILNFSPAFAVSSSDYAALVPITNGSVMNGVKLSDYSDGYYIGVSSGTFYVGFVGDKITLVNVDNSDGVSVYRSTNSSSWSYSPLTYNISFSTVDSTTGYKTSQSFNFPNNDYKASITLLSCSSTAELCQYVKDLIDNPPTPEPATTYNYTLQNGWLSVIDLGSSGASYNLTLFTSFAEYSHLSEPWWNSSQRYWFTDTMPAVGSTITNSETGSLITWDKTGNTDLFGRSKSAVATLFGTSTARYMVIYNPFVHSFDAFASGYRDEQNLPMNISGIPQGSTISLFKMDESMHITGGLTSTFISDAGSAVATGSALNITDTFVDSDGNSVVQNSGGANDIHESNGIVGYIASINDTLDNFTNQFVQLLSAPITHIQQLVASGTNFFGAFGSLFTWLPADVYQIIIGAFVVMVVIGVIKLLL